MFPHLHYSVQEGSLPIVGETSGDGGMGEREKERGGLPERPLMIIIVFSEAGSMHWIVMWTNKSLLSHKLIWAGILSFTAKIILKMGKAFQEDETVWAEAQKQDSNMQGTIMG